MTLNEFNSLSPLIAKEELFRCCGSTFWSEEMVKRMPFPSLEKMQMISDEVWLKCDEGDYLEAFSHHPKIGSRPEKKHKSTASWASSEQSGIQSAADKIKSELAEGNYQYQKKFGYIFIVCATGKTAEEMLGILKNRLKNDPRSELKIAAEEQIKITRIRIDKLIS